MSGAAPYQVMPALSIDERSALKADIAARGVMVPVEYDEHGNILDGHHRIELCHELGIGNWPRLVRYGLSEDEKRRHARRLNLDRRHLNADQKRDLIAAELRERPEESDRSIASGIGVDHKTVGDVRDALESTGEIPQLEGRKGKDGKVRRAPPKVVQFVPATDEEKKGLLISAKQVNEENRTQYRETSNDLARELSDATALSPTGRKFAVVYADPPWRRNAGFGNRSYENKYPTMSWDEICAMPVAERVLPDAWLFLWIPRAHAFAATKMKTEVEIEGLGKHQAEIDIPLAWRVARSWGFDHYSTCFVWTKTDDEHPDEVGSGLIVRDQDELLLLFRRGRGRPKPQSDHKFGSNHRERSKLLGHSTKPDFYRDMIATMTGGIQVLELFAREDAEHPMPPNFFTFGNQSKNTAELPGADGDAFPSPEATIRPAPSYEDLEIPAFLRRQQSAETGAQ